MESAVFSRGGSQRRSTLDVIMNQLRKKRPAPDRKSLGRLLSRNPERTEIPEGREEPGPVSEPVAGEREPGWGQVCVFLQRLGKKADSSSLSLSHCDLTATDLLELATLLRFLPELEELDVSWNDLIGGSLTALTSHLRLVGGMRKLRLCSCRLSADDIAALGEALGSLPVLETLDLSWNGGVGGGALPGLLGQLRPSMTELHLVACQLTAADAAALGALLPTLPRLSVLDLSCNPRLPLDADGGGGGFKLLASSLCHASSLTSLRLQACSLTPTDLQALGDSLHALSSITELDLSCNRTLAGGLDLFAPHLATVAHLERLDLHLCCLAPADLEALISVLPSLTALRELDVSANQEAGAAIGPLVSTLPLTRMKRLPLSSCHLKRESLSALALAVPHLLAVDVSWCKVVGGHLALLLDPLQPSVLLELRLSSCDLTTEDLHHLAAACKHGHLSSLRLLDLSYNSSVGDGGWSALFAAGGLGSLEELDLSLRPSASGVGAAWLPDLLAALPLLPALNRLALQRWTFSGPDRQRLDHCLRKRSVLLELDEESPGQPPIKESSSEE